MFDNRYWTCRDSVYIEVPPIDELCLALEEKFKKMEENEERLRKKINEIESETYKDEQLAEMHERLKRMQNDYYRGFPISEEEEESVETWMKEHEKIHKGGHGASGGKYTYEFIPTSIGIIGNIKCSCGETFCFQDIC